MTDKKTHEPVVSWEYEDFDNGCVISDTDSTFKECAEFNAKNCERVYLLLGRWLYDELQAFANKTMTSHIRINIDFEEFNK